MRHLWLLAMTTVLLSCSSSEPETLATTERQKIVEARSRPMDYGDLTRYNACKAAPRRALTQSDVCAIDLLSQDCTPAADCLVTCESSPDGNKVGGGCWHVCFSPVTGHKWSSRPDIDFSKCDTLRNG